MLHRYFLSSPLLLSVACGPGEGSTRNEHDADLASEADSGRDGSAESETDGSSGGDGDGESGGPDGGPGQPDAGASLDDIDLTLGGLNQDLPAPARDCLQTLEPSLVCLSFTGDHIGAPIAATCDTGSSGSNGTSRNLECTVDTAAGKVRVVIRLAAALVAPAPRAFEFFSPPTNDPNTSVRVYVSDRNVNTGGKEALLSHDLQVAVAGLSYHGPGWNPSRTSEFERGTFAITSTPKAGCVPDDMGFGCDSIRIRGVFSARTVAYID